MAQRIPGYRIADRRQVRSSSWPRPARRPASPPRAPALTVAAHRRAPAAAPGRLPSLPPAAAARLAQPLPPLPSLLCRPRHVHFRPGAVADRGQLCAGRAVGVRPARLHPRLLLHVSTFFLFRRLVGDTPCSLACFQASSFGTPRRRFVRSIADTPLPHTVFTLSKLIRCPIVLQAHRLHGPPRAPWLQLERHPRPTTPTGPAVGAVCRTLALKQALLPSLASTST